MPITVLARSPKSSFFFFNDTATTEIYTLSLHDALPISTSVSTKRYLTRQRENSSQLLLLTFGARLYGDCHYRGTGNLDRKSTRLNSSHGYISYAVFCLKKKKTTVTHTTQPITDSRS